MEYFLVQILVNEKRTISWLLMHDVILLWETRSNGSIIRVITVLVKYLKDKNCGSAETTNRLLKEFYLDASIKDSQTRTIGLQLKEVLL